MKNRIFSAAVALIAATNLAFVGGAAHATTYTPVLVKTLSTSGSGSIANIQAVGDKVVFEYNDAIWVSDGTEAGTVELDAPATLTSWDLQADRWRTYSAEIDGALYFFGWNSADSAYQVYETDGTSITQVTTGAGFSNYDLLVARGGDLYAWVENNENSNGYWDIDQITPAGVVSVLDGGNDCGPSRDATQIQLIGSKLIYRNDPTESCDYGIYAYDLGTDSIEELDTVAGLYGSEDYIYDNNDAWYVFNGEVYYSAYGASDIGYELFASDGTADGSRLVKDIYDGSNSSYPSSDYDCSFIPQTLGDYFFFTAYNNNGSQTLFKSDGTTGGTTEAVSDSNGLQYPGCETYSQPPVLNGKLIIDFWSSELSYEMYATDGSDAGTTLLKDIAVGGDAGLCNGDCVAQVLFDNHVFFAADDIPEGTHNQELWVTDGTPDGTVPVTNFSSSFPVGNNGDSSFIVAGDNLFFAVENWASDGGDDHIALYKIGAEELASTGNDATGSMWAGFGLLVAGVAVVTVRRRARA